MSKVFAELNAVSLNALDDRFFHLLERGSEFGVVKGIYFEGNRIIFLFVAYVFL